MCRSITGGCDAVLPAHSVLLRLLLLDVMEDKSAAVAVRLAILNDKLSPRLAIGPYFE